jgi:hypothetical protein
MAENWYVLGGVERKLGLADRTLDSFVLNTTMPIWRGTNNVANNVGCLYNVTRTTVGSITQVSGAVHQNLDIPFQVTVSQPNQSFINCRFTYSYSGDTGGGMVYCMPVAGQGTYFERCEFEPATPGDRYNGIYGHHFTAYRCAITKTVDGIGIYNSNAQPVNVTVQGCWIGHCAWFNDDRPAVGDGHSDGTHNDGIQWGSGTTVTVEGCFWQGAKYNVLNPANCVLDANWMDYTLSNGNGVTPLISSPPNTGTDANKAAQQGQLFLGQHSAYFHIDTLTYRHNWLWNFDHGFKVMSARGSTVSPEFSSGYSPVSTIIFENNIFGGTPRNWGSSQLYYPVRYDSNVTVNGVLHAAGGVFDDVNGNVWDASANVAATYGDSQPIAGNPVRHRVDLVPTS